MEDGKPTDDEQTDDTMQYVLSLPRVAPVIMMSRLFITWSAASEHDNGVRETLRSEEQVQLKSTEYAAETNHELTTSVPHVYV